MKGNDSASMSVAATPLPLITVESDGNSSLKDDEDNLFDDCVIRFTSYFHPQVQIRPSQSSTGC